MPLDDDPVTDKLQCKQEVHTDVKGGPQKVDPDYAANITDSPVILKEVPVYGNAIFNVVKQEVPCDVEADICVTLSCDPSVVIAVFKASDVAGASNKDQCGMCGNVRVQLFDNVKHVLFSGPMQQ